MRYSSRSPELWKTIGHSEKIMLTLGRSGLKKLLEYKIPNAYELSIMVSFIHGRYGRRSNEDEVLEEALASCVFQDTLEIDKSRRLLELYQEFRAMDESQLKNDILNGRFQLRGGIMHDIYSMKSPNLKKLNLQSD